MNGILALLISEEFCVETLIVKHTSFLASLPHLSAFTKCITLESLSIQSYDSVYYQVCPASAVLLCSPSYSHGESLI